MNATYPGLSHPTTLKFVPIRASILCKRAAYLHAGNALHAQGKYSDAREYYNKVLGLLESEPRSCRIDWERSSSLINIGDTFSRESNYDAAREYYEKAEQLGRDHLAVEDGNHTEAKGIVMVAKRAHAAALKRAGKDDEARALWGEVLPLSVEFNELMAIDKAEMKAAMANGSPSGDENAADKLLEA